MRFLSLKNTVIAASCILCFTSSARPTKPPRISKPLSQEQKQAVLNGVAQILNGVSDIVQDPHNPHNLGDSLGHIISGIINVAVKEIGKRNININDSDAVEKCIDEIWEKIEQEINELTKN